MQNCERSGVEQAGITELDKAKKLGLSPESAKLFDVLIRFRDHHENGRSLERPRSDGLVPEMGTNIFRDGPALQVELRHIINIAEGKLVVPGGNVKEMTAEGIKKLEEKILALSQKYKEGYPKDFDYLLAGRKPATP